MNMYEESDQASLVNFILTNSSKELQEKFLPKSDEPLVSYRFIIFDTADAKTSLPI